MLFSNYGLFWRADRVKWGRPGKGHTGTLAGIRTFRDGEVDFRDQRGVYALYGEGFRLLYVGQAGYGNQRLYQRLLQHKSDALAERWERFSWFGIDPVMGRAGNKCLSQREEFTPKINDILNHLEAILIASAEPTLNRQGGKFGKAKQFYQYFEEDELITSRLTRIETDLDRLLSKKKKS